MSWPHAPWDAANDPTCPSDGSDDGPDDDVTVLCLVGRAEDRCQLTIWVYTLGPALRIPTIKNVGRNLTLEMLRICP